MDAATDTGDRGAGSPQRDAVGGGLDLPAEGALEHLRREPEAGVGAHRSGASLADVGRAAGVAGRAEAGVEELLEPGDIHPRGVNLRAGEWGEGGRAKVDRAVGVALGGGRAREGRGVATVHGELDGFAGGGGGDQNDKGDGKGCDTH